MHIFSITYFFCFISILSCELKFRKEVKKNNIFFAVEGSKRSGDLYSLEALANGACKVVTSKVTKNKKYLVVRNVKNFLIEACSAKYKEKPNNIIAVTGTNGKSSVANFYYQILRNLKIPSAAIGTLGIFYNNKFKKTNLTTPDIITIHKELNFLKKNICHSQFLQVFVKITVKYYTINNSVTTVYFGF